MYPAQICSTTTTTSIQDELYCSSVFAQSGSTQNATCVAQKPDCGAIGKPCCIRSAASASVADCNKGAHCPFPFNETSVCVADTRT